MIFNSKTTARIGAIFYIVWGVLHFSAAYEVYKLGALQSPAMVQGRLFQDAWNLAFFALMAIVVAVWLNWQNDKSGFLINFFAVGVTDIGFIIFVLLPGYLPWIPGVFGPVFWILGAIFTTRARISDRRKYEPVNSEPADLNDSEQRL